MGRSSDMRRVLSQYPALVYALCAASLCQASTTSTYNAVSKYLGCYNDSMVSILSSAKLSTVAMTPQYCADYCGERGFGYGGIEFTTQCFCGPKPNFVNANKVNESMCNSPCVMQPSNECGAAYIMSLYEIDNPVTTDKISLGFTPACKTSPLSSHKICDTSLSISERVASLVQSLTEEEKITNLVDASAGAARIGLPPYEWWSEGLHGVAAAPGVQFTTKPDNYSYATSFPSPILSAAAFDDPLIRAIGEVVGREGRAFGNGGFSGFDFWAPNMNAFRDPRWGRGQETPGEDIFHVSNYVRNFVPGVQGDDVNDKQAISTCKHFAVYDIETGRYGNDYDPTQQEMADYFLPAFKTCARDVNVGSIMCSYNAVDGYPSCANQYLLQDVLRDTWNFTRDYNYVVSDCNAVTDIWQFHNFTNTETAAASVALNAGTDLECGQTYLKLNDSLALGQTTIARVDEALTRLYHALFTVGYFDGSKYSSLGWSDVATPQAQQLAYLAAVEGMTLLKNEAFLPLQQTEHRKVAVIGPYANATTQMQGDYSGTPKYIRSPLFAFNNYSSWDVTYAMGTDIKTNSTEGFPAALTAAKDADLIIYLGGIDNTIEAETLDRTTLTWPGNQLNLVSELSQLWKPIIVVQFGGGQLDDTALLNNSQVKALIWAGYPSQDGGPALLDVMVGKQSIAGRLPVTQYPADYVDEVDIFEIHMRPNATFVGRTYKWYTGTPVLPFGYGLHYTTFGFRWIQTLKASYDINDLVKTACAGKPINDITPFADVTIDVKNTGNFTSDYSGLLFISTPNAGPFPRPNKSLVSYSRLHGITIGGSQTLRLPLTLGSLARADINGDLTIFPGNYKLALDNEESLTFEFTLCGDPVVIETLPAPKAHYNYTVPVHVQPESWGIHT